LVEVEVLRNGRPLTPQTAGADVVIDPRGRSIVLIGEERLYRLIDDQNGYGAHTLTVVFSQAGLEAYTFTFG